VNNRGHEPRSLLRRLLKKADEHADVGNMSTAQQPAPPVQPPTAPPSAPAQPPKRATGETSPVRPQPPKAEEPPAPLMPATPQKTENIQIPVQVTDVQERLQAEEALENIRQKTAQIANEFAEGKINRAQFTAMYAHFNEKRVIIERLLSRDPSTQAWQSVAKGGHTTFLRQHFEARVLAYAIYDQGVVDPEKPIVAHGTTPIPPDVAKNILTAVNMLLKTRTSANNLRSLPKQIDSGRWMAIIPGTHTTALAMFSLEPSSEQFTRMQDLHRDFERANRLALERGIRIADQLVFPHRALFEKPTGNL
jgi:hypothetical protein